MKNIIKKAFVASTGVLVVAFPASAGVVVDVPEPGMLPLFAIAGIAFYIAKKRKK